MHCTKMTTEQQLSDTYKRQIKICEEAIDRLFDRWQKGVVPNDEYYSKINIWDDRRHEAANNLARIRK